MKNLTIKTVIILISLITRIYQRKIRCADLSKEKNQIKLLKILPQQKLIHETQTNNVYLLPPQYEMKDGSLMVLKEGNFLINEFNNQNKREREFYKILHKIDKENEYFSSYCNYFEFKDKSYLIIQYIRHDMFESINKNDHNEHFIKRLQTIKKIVKGISLLHLNNMIYCDLKVENFVIKDSGNHKVKFEGKFLRLIDFGEMIIKKKNNICGQGTEETSAPEQKFDLILKKKIEFNNREKSDIYSLGILILMLDLDYDDMVAVLKYNSDISINNLEKIKKIAEERYKRKLSKYDDEEVKKRIKDFVWLLLNKILVYYPSRRIGAYDLFLKLKEMLVFD